MKTVDIQIEGMSCGGCVKRVQNALAKLPGITAEKIDIGAARLHIDEPNGSLAAALDALQKIGFDARPQGA